MASALTSVRPADTGSEGREIAQAMELISQVRKDFQPRDDLYRYTLAVLFGDIDTHVPKGYRKIGKARHNPLANYYVNTIVAALTVNPPAVQFPVLGIGDAASTNATLREHFFDASWERQEDEAEAPLFRRMTYNVVALGEGILKTVPRTRTAWSDYTKCSRDLIARMDSGDLKRLTGDEKAKLYDQSTEEYKKTVAPYPIRSTDVDPSTFYYHRGEDGMTLAVEHKRVPYLETLVRYGMALDKGGRVVPQGMGEALPVDEWRGAMSGTQSLTMSEIWTWDRCRYVLSGPGQYATSDSSKRGTMARSFRHRYGDPITKSLRGPYAHAYGTTTASRLPERAGLGVLYGFLDLFVMLDELLTIQQINAVITGLASFKRNAPPPGSTLTDTAYGEDGLPTIRQATTIEPGTVYDYDIGPIEMPRAGAALGETIQQTREFIELILPKVLQGVVDTTDSGYQLALAARLGRIAFDPMVSNIRRAAARRVGFESWLIEHEIGETVYAYGTPVKKPGQRKSAAAGVLGIGPDDLKGIHRYKVVLNPEDKASELVEVRKHREMVDGRFESEADAIEALGGNAEEVEVKLAVQDMKKDPEMQAQLKQRIKQKVAMGQQRMRQQADALLGQVGPQGMPALQPGQSAPGAALQGMGQVMEAGQNGMPIAQGGPGEMPVPVGGLPASIPGQPPGAPPMAQQVNPNPAAPGLGMLGG